MKTRTLVTVIGVLVAAAMFSLPSAGAEPGTSPPSLRTDADAVNFVSACRFSHRAADDPIVYPGRPGAAHEHSFFANTSTNAFSTYESLRAGSTRCRRPGDTAAYWVPTLLEGDAVQPASHVLAYYVPAGKQPAAIKPFPAGLRVVTDPALPNTRWACVGREGSLEAAPGVVPTCGEGTHLVLRVLFPDCWDGRNLDSADHRTHLRYNRSGRCPSTHPVPLPRLRLNVHYPGSNGGDDVTLSSGGPETAHGDFFNAWDQDVLAALVARCLNAGVHCGQGGDR